MFFNWIFVDIYFFSCSLFLSLCYASPIIRLHSLRAKAINVTQNPIVKPESYGGYPLFVCRVASRLNVRHRQTM